MTESRTAVPLPSDQLAILEFNALRAEIVAHQNAQTTLIGATLAAVGVVLGLVLTDKATRVELLLVVPLIASGLGLIYANHSRASLLIGKYIADDLWPGNQYSWEHFLRQYRGSWSLLRTLEFMGGATVFVAPSVGALLIVFLDGVWNDDTLFLATFLWGLALVLLHVGLTIGVAIQTR